MEASESKITRLFEDYWRIVCYTPVDFRGLPDEQKHLHIPNGKLYVRLDRPSSYKFSGMNILFVVTANLLHLNPELSKSKVKACVEHIVSEHFYHKVSSDKQEAVVNWAWNKQEQGKLEPRGRIRKVFFKPNSGLTTKEKQQIAGRLSGNSKKLSEDEIYQILEAHLDSSEPLSLPVLAQQFECHPSTLRRSFTADLKRFYEDTNSNIRLGRDIGRYEQGLTCLQEQGIPITDYQLRKQSGLNSKRLQEIQEVFKEADTAKGSMD